MKKLLVLLIFLFAVYFGIQYAFKLFDKGHQISYEIGENPTIQVKETFTQNYKGEKNNYLFQIEVGSLKTSLQTYQDFYKVEQVIKDIKYFNQDGYECIYPITRGKKRISDVICSQNGTIQFYHNLVGISSSLDQFVSTLAEDGYQVTDYENKKENPEVNEMITLYKDQQVKGHYVSVETYRGVETYSLENLKSMVSHELFTKDFYKRPISIFAQSYYITTNYSEEFQFHSFRMVNITSDEEINIKTPTPLSFDGYFQGAIGRLVYYFDRENKKQYEIDLKTKTIIEVGNANLGIRYYQNGVWEIRDVYDAYNQMLTFREYTVTDLDHSAAYARVDKVGKERSGYYYWYAPTGNQFNVYRSNIATPEQRVYLFTISRMDQVYYLDDYIYFMNANDVNYYHDLTGIQTVFSNSEFSFNEEIKFGAYKK